MYRIEVHHVNSTFQCILSHKIKILLRTSYGCELLLATIQEEYELCV